jgi:preprotein translocase subunit SecG
MDLLLALSFMGNLVVGLFLLLCAALILIILLQKGRGGGLSAAFGGGGAGSLLGTKTGDFLTWVTIALVAGFLVLAVLMGKFMRPSVSTTSLAAPAPAATEDLAASETDDMAVDSDVMDEAAEPVASEATEAAEAATEERTEESVDEPAEETVEITE